MDTYIKCLNPQLYSHLGLFGFMLLSYHGNEVVQLDNFRQKLLVFILFFFPLSASL